MLEIPMYSKTSFLKLYMPQSSRRWKLIHCLKLFTLMFFYQSWTLTLQLSHPWHLLSLRRFGDRWWLNISDALCRCLSTLSTWNLFLSNLFFIAFCALSLSDASEHLSWTYRKLSLTEKKLFVRMPWQLKHDWVQSINFDIKVEVSHMIQNLMSMKWVKPPKLSQNMKFTSFVFAHLIFDFAKLH